MCYSQGRKAFSEAPRLWGHVFSEASSKQALRAPVVHVAFSLSQASQGSFIAGLASTPRAACFKSPGGGVLHGHGLGSSPRHGAYLLRACVCEQGGASIGGSSGWSDLTWRVKSQQSATPGLLCQVLCPVSRGVFGASFRKVLLVANGAI
jgi:hypothetical protein